MASPLRDTVATPLPKPARPGAAPSAASAQTLVFAGSKQAFAHVPHTTGDDLEAIVQNARAQFEKGDWRNRTASQRADTLRRISALILEHADELADLHTLETSIPIGQAKGMHIPRAAENFTFFADVLAGLAGETYDQSGRYLAIVTREPVGVAVLIAPWNAPLVLSSMKMAAAIALGNSIIVKPSEYAPLTVLRLCELVREAGVPEGVVQVALGPGHTVGKTLVRHPKTDVVGFIGGTETGKKIMADAASGLKKVGLELGGKSANIILESADIDRAIDGSLLAIFAGNGEQCLAGSRIMVERGVADTFIEKFVARTRKLRVGDPFALETEIGPMAFEAHFQRLLAFAATAKNEDRYDVLTGAEAVPGMDRGYYFAPTVVLAKDNGNDLCQEELFGPFATVQIVRDLDDALERANDSDFGLAGYIWSDDLPSVMRARQALRVGTVWVNTPMTRDLRAPFGGYKQSGIGRDGIPGSIDLFTEEKSTLIPNTPLTLPKLGA